MPKTPTRGARSEKDTSATSRERLLATVTEIHRVVHTIVLDDEAAQERHERIADLADGALVEEGVLVASLDPPATGTPSSPS